MWGVKLCSSEGFLGRRKVREGKSRRRLAETGAEDWSSMFIITSRGSYLSMLG